MLSPTNWIGVLISCAMPAASWPTDSSFWACRSSSSIASRSACARLASLMSNSIVCTWRPEESSVSTAPMSPSQISWPSARVARNSIGGLGSPAATAASASTISATSSGWMSRMTDRSRPATCWR